MSRLITSDGHPDDTNSTVGGM